MKHLIKYSQLARQKPGVLVRGTWGAFLTKVFKQSVLRGADIAVTYRCNAKCEKCSTHPLIDGSRQEMSKDQIAALLNEIAGTGAILINFTGGEPLLRGDITEIIACAAELPVIVSLSTLGFSLNDDKLKSFQKAGLNAIQISLNSPVEKEHDDEAGLPGSYRKVIESIKTARKLDMAVLINTVVTREKLYSDRLEKLVGIARENNCFLSLVLPAAVGGWKNKDVALKQEDFILLKKWIAMDCVTIDIKTCYKRGVCPAGIEKVYISPYGDVYPCPFIHKKYGNLLEAGFTEIWKKMSADIRLNGCSGCWNIKKNKDDKVS